MTEFAREILPILFAVCISVPLAMLLMHFIDEYFKEL